jgi:error-prone DNA polymerase
MSRLAEAGAFDRFGPTRREALWQARGLARERRDELPIDRSERAPRFRDLGPFETIAWDYTAAGHSTRGHPLGPLRDQLARMGLPDAGAVSAMRDGRRTRYAGMVICRQRPSTAGGVVFMTLEDETGLVNLVLWRDVFKRHEVIAKTSAFLGVTGEIQSQDGVVHLIAEELWVPALDLRPATAGSRDFH